MREGPVRLGHLVGVLATLDGSAATNAANVGATVSFSGPSNFTITSSATNGGLFDTNAANSSTLNAVGSIDLTKMSGNTPTGANDAIAVIDSAMAQIDDQRSSLGAVQNRFSSVVQTLSVASENAQASRGRIMDADFAQETANMTRAQILQQAGTAMVSQANSMPNNVLSLLQ